MKSFSRDKQQEWVEFEVDGETFKVGSVAPAQVILNVAAINQAKDLGQVSIIMEFLDAVMEPDSAARFAARLSSLDKPITIDQVSEVAVWLMEEVYNVIRPTQEPSPSANGQGTTGASSSDTASPTDGTSESKTLRVL